MEQRISLYRYFSTVLALVLFLVALAFAQSVALGSPVDKRSGKRRVSTASKAGTFVGATKRLGEGTVRSWVSLDREGKPIAIGLTFDEKALKTAPMEVPAGQEGINITLALPREASATAFNHILFGWNPHGHPPKNIYDVAHFDIHFYTISPEERQKITAQGDDLAKAYLAPAPEYVPAGYILPPDTAVPDMGAHWINTQASELNGQPFTKTFLFGNYNGQIIFYEPMITRSFFETKVNVTEFIKQPQKYAKPGYYPTRYSAKYDPAKKEYTVALEGMTLRQ